MGILPGSATAMAPTGLSAPYLKGLNPEQFAAVTAEDGPLLVLAGAGTGKTRVLTTRLAHILITGRARPQEVLAVTFTNRAAREMAERVEGLIGRSVSGMWLGTFHAMGVRMIRAHAELIGLQPSFTILDSDDQERLAKQVIQAAELDERRWPARLLVGTIQRWKDRGYRPDQVPASEAGDFALGKGVELYAAYQQRLTTLNACDFGDLLLHGLTLLTGHADVLAQYQRRFRAILVDEYQDTNVAQYLWLRLLAGGHKNVTCVGDDDQSIYSWRGAEVGNILRFEQDFPGAQVIRLERNYRSTGHILGAASGVIARNRARHGKTLWTEDEQGEQVRVAGLWDDQEEARFVADEVEAWQRQGGSLNQAAVLVRAGFQTRSFEERFIQLGIPYRVVGGPRFYERAEIRDAIAYFRVICQPDDDLALERIVNLPRRGIGDSTLRSLRAAARGAEISLSQAARAMCQTDELPARARNALLELIATFDRWRGQLRERPPRELAESGARRIWLHGDVAGGAHAGRARSPGEPEGAGQGGAGVRDPAGLPRACQPGDGERGRAPGRSGQHHDPARCQGPRVRQCLPVRLGGGAVPEPASDRRGRQQGARGGAPAGLCRHHPRPPPSDRQLRRQPSGLQSVVVQRAVALRRGVAAPSISCICTATPLPAPTSAPSSTTSRSPRAPPADSARAGRRWAS